MATEHRWYRDDATGQHVFDVSVLVNAPVDDCFAVWTNFESFPKLMSHVTDVRVTGPGTQHWEADIAGQHVEWEAKTTELRPNEVISWTSTSGQKNSGSVYFTPEGRGCRVAVHLAFDPAYGPIGDLVASTVVNDRFYNDLERDMMDFKRNMETGRGQDYLRKAA